MDDGHVAGCSKFLGSIVDLTSDSSSDEYSDDSDVVVLSMSLRKVKRKRSLPDDGSASEQDQDQTCEIISVGHSKQADGKASKQAKWEDGYEQKVIYNASAFKCPICFDDIEPGQGVVLWMCCHSFCTTCLVQVVSTSTDAEVTCPSMEDGKECEGVLLQTEIKAFSPEDVFQELMKRSLKTAAATDAQAFYCQTADCSYFIINEGADDFSCPKCGETNCLKCKAIHRNMTCEQYREFRSKDANYLKNEAEIKRLIEEKLAMLCPICGIVCQKIDGCNHIQCAKCKTHLCWGCQQRRKAKLTKRLQKIWGVKPTSAVCKCR